ncbi:hypothetical protein EG68_00641 [Paragonimus skrjabini miyazakii]|uniref:Uncharacterized protein n=1 Tax=Paragonimus skrjabini miyazakii TaxID=59628 RepID=A0A8S9Z9W1_9TREM|nr:hypothetical protein EG68_00641 [Paragonimus skrjabini miyazakii]
MHSSSSIVYVCSRRTDLSCKPTHIYELLSLEYVYLNYKSANQISANKNLLVLQRNRCTVLLLVFLGSSYSLKP